MKQDSSKVWAGNIELGVMQNDVVVVVVVEAVGSAQMPRQVVIEEEKSEQDTEEASRDGEGKLGE